MRQMATNSKNSSTQSKRARRGAATRAVRKAKSVGGKRQSAQSLFSEAREVVVKDHIHDPVEAVLDTPMGADGGGECPGVERRRGDVEAPRARGLAIDLAAGLDHGQRTRRDHRRDLFNFEFRAVMSCVTNPPTSVVGQNVLFSVF